LVIGFALYVFDDIVTVKKDVFYFVVSKIIGEVLLEFINGVSMIINDIGNFFRWLFSF